LDVPFEKRSDLTFAILYFANPTQPDKDQKEFYSLLNFDAILSSNIDIILPAIVKEPINLAYIDPEILASDKFIDNILLFCPLFFDYLPAELRTPARKDQVMNTIVSVQRDLVRAFLPDLLSPAAEKKPETPLGERKASYLFAKGKMSELLTFGSVSSPCLNW
jgi:hypothetical protein